MIAMSVSDENVGDGLAAHGVEQRGDMRLIKRSGIDDRDLALSDDVGDRSLVGERARIIRKQAPHPWLRLLDLAGDEVERLVEGDVCHLKTLVSRAQRSHFMARRGRDTKPSTPTDGR